MTNASKKLYGRRSQALDAFKLNAAKAKTDDCAPMKPKDKSNLFSCEASAILRESAQDFGARLRRRANALSCEASSS